MEPDIKRWEFLSYYINKYRYKYFLLLKYKKMGNDTSS
jgi:hypothetical protein